MYSWTLKLLTFPPKNRVSVFLVKSQIHGEAWEGGFSFHAEMLRCMMWGVMMYDVGCYDGTGAYGQSLSCVRRVRASVRTNRASLLVNKVESGACCFACLVTYPGTRRDFVLMLGRWVLDFSAYLLLSSSGHE